MSYLDKFGVSDIEDLLGRADLLGLKISNSDLSKSLHKILMLMKTAPPDILPSVAVQSVPYRSLELLMILNA